MTTPPTCSIIGDSYAAGWGAVVHHPEPGDFTGAWWTHTLPALGWALQEVVASPGAGYVRRGDYGTLREALTRWPLDAGVDFVLLQGGLNDEAADPAAVRAGADALLALIRQQAPGAVPIVIGPWVPNPGAFTPNALRVARAVAAACATTRYKTGLLAGYSLEGDGRHPDGDGHRTLGRWASWHIANGLDNAPPLRRTSAGWYAL